MAITKQKTENRIVYSLGEEVLLTVESKRGKENALKIEGAIKTLVAPCFEEVISEAMAERSGFVLDFSGVSYIASAGLRVLLNMQQEIDEKELPDTVLVNVTDAVKEVFEQTGFCNILNIQQ